MAKRSKTVRAGGATTVEYPMPSAISDAWGGPFAWVISPDTGRLSLRRLSTLPAEAMGVVVVQRARLGWT